MPHINIAIEPIFPNHDKASITIHRNTGVVLLSSGRLVDSFRISDRLTKSVEPLKKYFFTRLARSISRIARPDHDVASVVSNSYRRIGASPAGSSRFFIVVDVHWRILIDLDLACSR